MSQLSILLSRSRSQQYGPDTREQLFDLDLSAHKYFASELSARTSVTVSGRVGTSCLSFAINFVCSNPTKDVALSFSPNLEQRYVARNCRVNGFVGEDETTSWRKFDFRVGDDFDVDFLLNSQEILVAVNGKHFCSFAHRVEVKSICGVEVRGDLEDVTALAALVTRYPAVSDVPRVMFNVDYEPSAAVTTPDNPYIGFFDHRFKPGYQLEIYGKVKLLPHSFFVNIQDGDQYWPHPEVFLHIGARFDTFNGTNMLVQNARTRLNWFREQHLYSPFRPGFSFCIVIRIELRGYSVWVNRVMVGEFHYFGLANRLTANYLFIQGDVIIHHVTMRTRIKDVRYENPIEKVTKL